MNDFTEKFSTYSNTDLLKIIKSPNDYQPLAVETAKTIFASRQLSEEDIENAKVELETQQKDKDVQAQEKSDLENKVKNIAGSLVEIFNPIQNSAPTTDKVIKIISIIIGGLFLFQVYRDFGMLRFMFTDSSEKWDFSMVLYFLPLLMKPIAALLFYKRKKIGWSLLTIFLTYTTVNTLSLIFLVINTKPSGIPSLDNMFPTTSPIAPILAFIFFGGLLWFICTIKIREVYNINRRLMFMTLISIALLALFINFGLLV